MNIWLAKIVGYDPDLPGTRTLYYGSKGFVTGPSDTPANTYFAPRIKQAPTFQRDMFSAGTTFGRSRMGFGNLTLANDDGGLDSIATYGFDGRAITIYFGEHTGTFPTDFTTFCVATMAQVEFGTREFVFKLRGREAELDVPLQSTLYAGNNSLPAGLEGVSTDIGGKPKPLCWGKVRNGSAICVNTSKLIYQVSAGVLNTLDDVYDQGVALTSGGTYANQTDLLDNALAPAAGGYKVLLAEGYFRLGSSPDGEVTFDANGQAGASANPLPGHLFTEVMSHLGFSDYSSSDVTAINAAVAYEAGIFTGPSSPMPKQASGVLDLIAQSVYGWWGQDRLGVIRFQQFHDPLSAFYPATVSFTANDMVEPLVRSPANDPGDGLPCWETVVSYSRNYTVQTSGLAGSVSDDRRAELASEWLTQTANSSAVLTHHLLAPRRTVETLLEGGSAGVDASNTATAIQNIFGYRPRDRFNFAIPITAANLAAVDIGTMISVTHSRFGLSGGKKFVVLGIETARVNQLDIMRLTVWG